MSLFCGWDQSVQKQPVLLKSSERSLLADTACRASIHRIDQTPVGSGMRSATIQAEQEAAAGMKARKMKKSLEHIQYEERAMEGLDAYYKQTRVPGSGEYVTIVQIS
ncbi:hypothetical protein SeMB42_g02727 [Synchytrium endobioticum]|uniref:Uncharacterized protein n=1 Tax=Synchytrium endobioticum TaxID=286115 RepID=A0A507DBN6_9FUNG|nr:hypothetical protein SeMB42_g02727 [Synchytrium endobioticum]